MAQSGEAMGTDPKAGERESADVKRAKWLAASFIIVPLVLTLTWGIVTRLTTEPVKEEKRAPVAVGHPAPNFTYDRLGGGKISLADMKGKLVLVNVWATWCPPCLEEMPSMQRLYGRMKREGRPFEILAVSIDALGGDVVQKFIDRFKITFPILLDPRGSIKKLYATTGVPETFLVGTDGRLVQKIIGIRKWDAPEVIRYLTGLMAARGPKKS